MTMRVVLRAVWICLLTTTSFSSLRADDGVALQASRGASPGDVRLDWTGGGPGYTVYRATSPSHIVAPGNELGGTASLFWIDTPPGADLVYYLVLGPCITPSAEGCDGIDDDCDGIVDNACSPCGTDLDCTAESQPSVCDSPATCQGTRQQGMCNAFQECVAQSIPDDSGCAGLVSNVCGPYPEVTCTAAVDQTSDQNSLCASSCLGDPDCDAAAHCSGSNCVPDAGMGGYCTAQNECDSSLYCTDNVCCSSPCGGVCEACDLTGDVGSCAAVPAGQDPDAECGAVSCNGYYWGWTGDTCYRKADVSAAQATCGGARACRSTAAECGLQTAKGTAAVTCNSLCQDPNLVTCTGTTAGTCTNVNPGTQTCGQGVCQVTVNQCSNGSPVTCVPNGGAATTETCNGIDDNCDGIVDNNSSFADGFEPDDSCAAFRTLQPTVGSDQTVSQNALTLYPSGDVDYYKINAVETDSTCACCDLFCTDEDYTLRITLTVPTGAGSYQLCTSPDCNQVGTACVTAQPGTPASLSYAMDGSCGATDAYAVYVRVSPGSAPGYSCAPYTLSYFFDALVCNGP